MVQPCTRSHAERGNVWAAAHARPMQRGNEKIERGVTGNWTKFSEYPYNPAHFATGFRPMADNNSNKLAEYS